MEDSQPTRRRGVFVGGWSRVGLWGIPLCLALAGGWSLFEDGTPRAGAQSSPTPTPPAAESDPGVHALARLEPLSGLVTIGSRPGARIDRIAVKPHDLVQGGALLAVLEGHAQAEAQLGLALAQKASAEHQRDLKKQQLALEREYSDKTNASKLELARRVFGAKQRWNEIASLFKQISEDKNLSPRDRFDLQLRYFEAENQNLRGELEIRSFELAQTMQPKRRKLEDAELEGNGPDQELLDRQIDLARAGVAQAEIRAPFAGEVLEILAKEGEVGSGPLMLFGDPTVMAASAEVYQADVPRIGIGDPATVQILDEAIPGKVTDIGVVVGKNQLTSLDPRALQDRRVVKVTIRLDDAAPARRFINMEVDVTIRPGAGSGEVSARSDAHQAGE